MKGTHIGDCRLKEVVRVVQYGMAPENECGGVESYLFNQFKAMDPRRVRYDFIAKRNDSPMSFHREIVAAGSQIFGLPHRREHPVLHYLELMRLLWRERGVYHAFVVNASTVNMATILLVARLFGIKRRIYHAHTSGIAEPRTGVRRIFDFLNLKVLPLSATHYFACSQKAGEWMFGSQAKFSVVNNAVRAEDFIYDEQVRRQKRVELGLENAFIVGVVGNFTKPKNFPHIVRIFAELRMKVPEARLVICGREIPDDDTYRCFISEVREKEFGNAVVELGFRSDVPALMQAFDCFLMPSFFEGLPVAGVEAQFADLPCFFSDTITREVAFTENAHYLPLEADAAEWAGRIASCRDHKRRRLSEQSVAQSGFDVKYEAQRMMEFYKGAM